ncbi:bowman-birk serine protease inhibitor family protein, putative (macronuclear) [Tetrahymena thermophila SB210]|uniref:Bowman-birk serine protease inhibitor family protein, putative n=1 Tax=Tetrahymena thermophila (strain SB210) TaxID=312017 RepID=I7M737_TETTS|nr:bowman-birk serine protease inhibitor family protein, putative [Tetrahymena thermophila SB210]EAR89309.2 bowman-birk serine protease inhibitor family protein, putative [Tetrahymena thermophila SB210]|eukprot:XP_001009554.2 bowman-birk serine protease inhibitor family protein, putative [Tetrahymena thermophila SB210]
MAVVYDQLLIQPCNVLPDNKAQIFLFSKLFSDMPSLSKFTVSGWFLFQGQYNQEYSLFSVHRNGNLIVSLSYDNSNIIYLNVQGLKSFKNNPLVSHNTWINIVLDFDTSNLICTVMVATPSGRFSFNQSISYVQLPILLNELTFNGGNPPKILTLNPSCSQTKKLYLYINSQLNISSLSRIEDYIYHTKSSLFQHYDYYYTLKNDKFLVGDYNKLQQKIFLNINNNQEYNVLQSGQSFYTANIILQGQNEYIVSFYVKISSLQTIPQSMLQIYNYGSIKYVSFKDNSFMLDSDFLPVSSVTQWNQIVIIFNQYGKAQISLIVQGSGAYLTQSSITIPCYFMLQFLSLNVSFQLSHIRIFLGSALYSTLDCFLQTFDGICIICQQGYLLDFQNKMKCVQKQSPYTDYDIIGVKDSPQRIQCPQDMVNDINSSNNCVCLRGFYFDGNQCQKCPSYCLYCNSLSDCSSDRDQNRKCINSNYFDDGKNCIQPLLIIPSTNNLRYTISKPNIGQGCGASGVETDPNKFIFTQFQLNMNPSDKSIFFSFGISILAYNSGFNQIQIARVFKNNKDILNIFLKTDTNPANGDVFFSILFTLDNSIQKQFQFFPFDTVWLAYWSDNINHIFMVNSNRVNEYEEYRNYQVSYDNQIQICIGRCDVQLDTTLNCFSLYQFPFTFIKNINYPTTEGIDYLFRFMAKDVQLLAKYAFDSNQSNFQNEIKNNDGILSSTDLIFVSPLQFYNVVQGFGLSQTTYGNVNFLAGNTFQILTTSFNIEFQGQIQEQLILFYQMIYFSNISIVFYFEFYLALNIFRIIVCLIEGCKSTQNAVLYLNQSNFVLIHPQNYRTMQDIKFLEYFQVDIVCNQVKESLFFQGLLQTEGLQNIQISIPGQYTLLYIDNFSIYDAYGFIYYDYTQLNPCYIYINVQNMKCIRLKNGYLYYKNAIITQKQCLQLSVNTNQIFVINLKNQTCDQVIVSSQDNILCAVGEYVNGIFICKICKDQNADPTKNCLKCLSSYFLNQSLKKCQKCSAICKECIDDMNNCTDCYFPDQGPPSLFNMLITKQGTAFM